MTPGDIEQIVAEQLGTIRGVSHVFTQILDAGVLVWIAVEDPLPEIRYRIFNEELALIHQFPETLFDFNVIPRMGRDAHELVQGGAWVLHNRSNDLAFQD